MMKRLTVVLFCLSLTTACGRLFEFNEPDARPSDPGFVRDANGGLYSVACLRSLRGATEMPELDSCRVSPRGASARGFGGWYPDSWYYDPYTYYYPNWCWSYLRWPSQWCNYYWPPRQQPDQRDCNTACLCGVTYGFDGFCPAIACSVEDMRACGVYNW